MSQELADYDDARHEAILAALRLLIAEHQLAEADSSALDVTDAEWEADAAAGKLALAVDELAMDRQPAGWSEPPAAAGGLRASRTRFVKAGLRCLAAKYADKGPRAIAEATKADEELALAARNLAADAEAHRAARVLPVAPGAAGGVASRSEVHAMSLTPAPLARCAPLESRTPLKRNTGLPLGGPWGRAVPLLPSRALAVPEGANAPTGRSGGSGRSGRGESFPPDVAALLAARDPWCIHCGSPYDLQNHHRRIRGIGGDPRPHTSCTCVGVRICRSCHEWVHSGNGRREAEAEGLIIPRATTEPWAHGVLVHAEDGGATKYPSCAGEWLDYVPEAGAA